MFRNRKNKDFLSKDIAKGRLKSILSKERTDVNNQLIDIVKQDIIEVTKEYFTIKKKGVDIYLTTATNKKTKEDEDVIVCVIPLQKASSPT